MSKAKESASSMTNDKLRIIKEAIATIEKQFGAGAIMRLGEQEAIEPIAVIPSGSVGIDIALGTGGYPRGRIVEVFGPESSGKTTLALHAIAEVHKAGGVAAFIDAEHALDLNYARALGVQPENLLLSQPDSGEQALEICETLVRSGAVDLLVLDSVAALVPRAEIDGEMGDQHMGLQARLMSQALRKLTAVAHKSRCTLLFINQLRQKIGVVFGNPETTTGGNALKFYASVRLDVRRVGAIKEGERAVGNRTRVKVVKNKLAPPFAEVELDMMFGRGFWAAGDLLDRAIDLEVVAKSGSWFAWADQQLAQGRDKTAQLLEADPNLYEAVRAAVWAKRQDGTPVPLVSRGPVKAESAEKVSQAA